MMTGLLLKVTEKDMILGIPRDVHHCPLAYAIEQVIPDSYIYVGRSIAFVSNPHDKMFFNISYDAKRFMNEFDRLYWPKPRLFCLDLLFRADDIPTGWMVHCGDR